MHSRCASSGGDCLDQFFFVTLSLSRRPVAVCVLGPSAGASANTSSRAGTPPCAGPGTAHARPSAVWPIACCTAVEQWKHVPQASRSGCAGWAAHGGWGPARAQCDQAPWLWLSSAHQYHTRARKGTEPPPERARGRWIACDALPLSTQPYLEKGPSMVGYHPDEVELEQ